MVRRARANTVGYGVTGGMNMDRQQDKREELAQELEQLLGAAAGKAEKESDAPALGVAAERKSDAPPDALGAAVERKPDALGVTPEPAVCGFCFHPYHEGTVCEHTRTIHGDGIEIDGPCGCGGEEIGNG